MSSIELPLVSILIPTHNRPNYFEMALKTALLQSYHNIEIVVSDNSDGDETCELIAPYLERHENIVYSRVVGYSLMENFQNAYRLARGEYINYLMDDDLFHPEKIERMIPYLLSYPDVGMVTSYRQLIGEDGGNIQAQGFERLTDTVSLLNGVLLGNALLTGGVNIVGEPTTVLFRKSDLTEAFGTYRGYQYRVLQDVATWLSISKAKNCVYIPEPLSYFRIHGGQDQRQNSVKIQGMMEGTQMLCDAYDGSEPCLADRTAARHACAKAAANLVASMPTVKDEFRDGKHDLEALNTLINRCMRIAMSD